MFSDFKQFFLMMTLLAFAILGACTEFCRASENDTATMVLRYKVDMSLLPPKTKIDMQSLIVAIKERLPADARVMRFGETGIDAAVDVPLTKWEVILKGQSIAKWVPVYSTDFDPTFLLDSNIVSRTNHTQTELLVWKDPDPLTGNYLLSAEKAFDDKRMIGIKFEFNKDGAKILRRQTAIDSEKGDSRHVLGLFIDDRAYSGTVIKERLDSNLFIGSLPEHEIDSVLSILNAGTLPYPLKERK